MEDAAHLARRGERGGGAGEGGPAGYRSGQEGQGVGGVHGGQKLQAQHGRGQGACAGPGCQCCGREKEKRESLLETSVGITLNGNDNGMNR